MIIITINDDIYMLSESESSHIYVDTHSSIIKFVMSGREATCQTDVVTNQKAVRIVKEIKEKLLEGKKNISITFKEEFKITCD